MAHFLRIEDLSEKNMNDVFAICSHNKLNDPLQREGIELKRRWLNSILSEYGSCTKIAYLEGTPVAQMLFYPEKIVPFLTHPRKGVVVLHCIYNPFPDAQGKGAGSLLLEELITECKSSLPIMKGEQCNFMVARSFDTGSSLSLEDFYLKNGFKEGDGEMYFEIFGKYHPPYQVGYYPLPEDLGRAVVFYDSMCEWAHPFASRVKELLQEIRPNLVVTIIDRWEKPEEYIRRGSKQLIVNAKPIESFWTDTEAFRREVEEALDD